MDQELKLDDPLPLRDRRSSNKQHVNSDKKSVASIYSIKSSLSLTTDDLNTASDEDASPFLATKIQIEPTPASLTEGFDPFAFIRNRFNTTKSETSDKDPDVDWDFWGKVVSDFDKIATKQSKTLTRKIHQGIPSALRGMVWQLLCKGKNPQLELVYTTLQSRATTHEKLIQRDLARTFPNHEYFQNEGPGQDALFNILKAYSLYDLEVGYCQGISFVVGALLLNMPEEEAFCALVQLMKQYHYRTLYTPDMVLKHLEKEGIVSTMYASQWFMTIFAYRFPLEIVFSIMDVIFAEGMKSSINPRTGIDAMFRIALALLKKNRDTILTLEFESLLAYLKEGLFDVYMDTKSNSNLILDAACIRISQSRLDKLQAEFMEKLKNDTDPELLAAAELRTTNRHLIEKLKKVEEAYQLLDQEHRELTEKSISHNAIEENMRHRIEELEEQVGGLRQILVDDRKHAECQVKQEMDQLMNKNLQLTQSNIELSDLNNEVQEELINVRKKLMQSQDGQIGLEKRLSDLKKALEH